MARQLAITKRTSLVDFEGWGKECYVEWRPITYKDSLKLNDMNLDDVNDAKAFEAIFNMTKEHVVGGKVKILGDDDQMELVDYEADDLDNMPPEMVNRIFEDLTGAQFDDPKDTPKALEASDEPTQPESDTETSSSEASATKSESKTSTE